MSKIFSADIIQQTWEKASVIKGKDSTIFRKDKCGAIMQRDLFNKNENALSSGWKIDHIKPLEKGGKNELSNLQALQWENHQHKKIKELAWDCKVGSVNGMNYYLV